MKIDRLKKGNSKLAKGIYIFDLPTGKSCPNSSQCILKCYARKAEKIWPNVANWRKENFDLAKHDPILLARMLERQIRTNQDKIIAVRVHSAGDFFSQQYVNFWANIAKKFSYVRFYAYTKAPFDFSCMPSNFNIIYSFIDGKLNFGKLDYVADLVNNHGAFLCPATNGQDSIKCGKDCTYCMTEKRPVFLQH